MKKRIDNDKLIHLIRRRRSLWDKNHEHFFNKLVKYKVWEEISQEMGHPRGFLKSKWKSLRDVFRRELRKTLDKTTSYQSEWVHYDKMYFLKDQLSMRELKGQNQRTDEHNNGDDDEDDYDDIITLFNDPTVPVQTITAENLLSVKKHSQDEGQDEITLKSEKASSHEDLTEYHIHELPSEKMENSVVVENHDDDYYFALSLLPYMRSVSTERKLNMRMKIIQIIQDENNHELKQ